MLDNDAGSSMKVRVFSQKGVVWEGSGSSVSSVNSQGAFDVLPKHAHFITLIDGEPIRVQLGQEEMVFEFSNAVMWVIDDTVTIYADIEEGKS